MELNLKALMKEKGITQERLAEDLKMPPSTLSRWVGNKIDRVDLDTLAKIKVRLDCEWDDLLKVVKK